MSPEPEDRGAVGDDGDGVLLDRQLMGQRRMVLDGRADPGHAGRVGHRQVVAVVDRHAGEDLDLAALVHGERAVRHLDDLDPVDGLDRRGDLLDVLLRGAVDDEVLVEVAAPHIEAADGRDVAAYLTDGRRQTSERAGPVVEPHAKGDGEGCGGSGHRRRRY